MFQGKLADDSFLVILGGTVWLMAMALSGVQISS